MRAKRNRRGEASGIDKMIAGLEKKAKEEAGIPTVSNPLEISMGNDNGENKDTGGASTPKAKANGTEAASKTADGEEVVDSYKDAHDAEIAEETTTLLHGFARQPEEWENHQSICCCICFLLLLTLL